MGPVNLLAPHPHGIKPSGNLHASSNVPGHGSDVLGSLPDEVILNLLQFLDLLDLVSLGLTCKKLYAFSLLEELWKDLYTGNHLDRPWLGNWRNSCLGIGHSKPGRRVLVSDVYSDLLFRPYMNTQIDLRHYLPTKKSNLIPRVDSMTLASFEADHVHHPFILTKEMADWPAMRLWTTESLLDRFAETRFRAECVDWPLQRYVDYMRDNQDESPLYLFDSHFAEKTARTDPSSSLEIADHESNSNINDINNINDHDRGNGEKDRKRKTSLADEYTIPPCFAQDAFTILSHDRPDHRWLILGPARSGSTFHKDPNGTCAWNAVVTGAKLWIMSPPDHPPPGVYVSADEAEVTSPLSIAEWLVTYHRAARQGSGRLLEGVCGAGEVLYVPSGWWHLVVNLDECLAVTQNFVPRAYIGKVLRFLRDKREQVSGFHKSVQAYELFEARLKVEYPDAWAAATKARAATTWESLKTGKSAEEDKEGGNRGDGGFTFGFDDSSDGGEDA